MRCPAVDRSIAALALAGVLACASVPVGPEAAQAKISDSSFSIPGTLKAKVVNRCLLSVPDPGTTTPVQICYTIFRPARANNRQKVPMLLHGPGFGLSRTRDPVWFKPYLDAGYGVLSFDQRGFGESGGQAHLQNPDVEGYDVRALVERIANLRWVQQDGPGDPRLGAIGGSYGGASQFLGAFEELRAHGKPLFDALAPELTWYDLAESLAPSGVVRTRWVWALSRTARSTQALPPSVEDALDEGVLTANFLAELVDGAVDLQAFMEKNGPRWQVANGRRLDIPVLLRQGTTDTFFPLQQGLANWHHAITKTARKRSIFIGFNGGHPVPPVVPPGFNVTSDPCSQQLAGSTFQALAVRFFDEQLKHEDTGLTGYRRLHIATTGSECLSVRSDRPNTAVPIDQVSTPTTATAPLVTKIADGPIAVAGTPTVTASVTSFGVDTRIFYGLAVGTNAQDARLVQNNVLPLREPVPVALQPTTFSLPAVGVRVPAGQSLFLLSSPFSDTFAGQRNHAPGLIWLTDTVVGLHVVRR